VLSRGHVPQLVRAEIEQADAFRQRVADKGTDRVRHEDLAAPRGRHQASGAVDLQAAVVPPVDQRRLSGVDTHADPD